MTAVIGATHVLCSIGNGTEQVWASARAGIARIASSHVMNRRQEAIQMGMVREEALAPLNGEFGDLPLPPRARRLLRLAAPSLRAAAAGVSRPVPLFVGLPRLAHGHPGWMKHVPAYLQRLAGVPVDRARSAVIPHGRAAGLMALEQALALVQADPEAEAIVGGVDSYFDLRLLAELDREARILGPGVKDGFIPGEGAAFLRISAADRDPYADGTRVVVHAAASVMDAAHRHASTPARGEGLAMAVEGLRQRLRRPLPPVATTFAGFNGESFDAKLWGVARLRHSELFAPDMVIEHPADKFGDVGAAMGSLLVALAAQSLQTGTRTGPALVWAASDDEPRACALVALG